MLIYIRTVPSKKERESAQEKERITKVLLGANQRVGTTAIDIFMMNTPLVQALRSQRVTANVEDCDQ